MKTLKRISLLLLSVLLIFTFAGCDRGKVAKEETTDVTNSNIETPENEFIYPFEFEVYSFNEEEITTILSELSTDLSQKAKDTLVKYKLNRRTYAEGTDSTGTKMVLYNVFNYTGVDEAGAYYNSDGTPMGIHDKCNKILGCAEDMCDGYCAFEFTIN